jgi:hypothetical protein
MSSYYDLVNAEVLRLQEATGYPWEHWTTGGGCDSYAYNLHDSEDSYWLITHDATAPTTPEEWNEITLGFYSDSNEEGEPVDSVLTFADLVQFFNNKKKEENS